MTELFREVGPKVGSRPGGYTRIIRMPENRLGDAAEMAMMELVDYNENLLNVDKKATKAKSTRRSGKKVAKAEATPVVETTPAEEVKE